MFLRDSAWAYHIHYIPLFLQIIICVLAATMSPPQREHVPASSLAPHSVIQNQSSSLAFLMGGYMIIIIGCLAFLFVFTFKNQDVFGLLLSYLSSTSVDVPNFSRVGADVNLSYTSVLHHCATPYFKCVCSRSIWLRIVNHHLILQLPERTS